MALDEAQPRAPLVTFSFLISYCCCFFQRIFVAQKARIVFVSLIISRSTLMTPYFCSVFFLIPYTVFLAPSLSGHSVSYGSVLPWFSQLYSISVCVLIRIYLSFPITCRLYCSRDAMHVTYGNLARIIPGLYLIVRSSWPHLTPFSPFVCISVIPCPNLRIHDKLFVI